MGWKSLPATNHIAFYKKLANYRQKKLLRGPWFGATALNITILHHYAEWSYAECRALSFVMLNVIMLSVILLSVVAPIQQNARSTNAV